MGEQNHKVTYILVTAMPDSFATNPAVPRDSGGKASRRLEVLKVDTDFIQPALPAQNHFQ